MAQVQSLIRNWDPTGQQYGQNKRTNKQNKTQEGLMGELLFCFSTALQFFEQTHLCTLTCWQSWFTMGKSESKPREAGWKEENKSSWCLKLCGIVVIISATHFRLCHLASSWGRECSGGKNAPLASGAVLLAYFLPQPSLECPSLLIVSQLHTGFEWFLTTAMDRLPCLLWWWSWAEELGGDFCPCGMRLWGSLPFQKWLQGQDCQEADREAAPVLFPTGWQTREAQMNMWI